MEKQWRDKHGGNLMTDKLWKQAERRVARLLGGERVPVTGRGRGNQPDIAHPTFSLEVKHREIIPDWMWDAMRQAVASKRGTQMPLVILHAKGMKYEESFAVFQLADVVQLMAKIDKLEQELKERST